MEAEMLAPYTARITYSIANTPHRQRFLLLSDLHWDNPLCERVLLKKHLEQAKANEAPILIFGDLFCAMQGKYDPRSSKASLRPEHQVQNYLDALVDTAVEFFKPYQVIFVSPGNHETAILKRQETDLTKRFADGIGCVHGTYQGWVVFRAKRSGTVKTLNLAYHHGYGGGGQVTKDIIQASRKAVYLPDADIVVSGHTHDRWIFPIEREHITARGKRVLAEQLHLKLGNYKDEFTPGVGWSVESGHGPKSTGGVWLYLDYRHNDSGDHFAASAELSAR